MASTLIFLSTGAIFALRAQTGATSSVVSVSGATAPQTPTGPPPAPERHFYIQQYRVMGGGHLLPRLKIEESVYPYLGPYRTPSDVEQARQALEKAYHDAGYQTVLVQTPPQQITGGVITLQVVPQAVGRLRVRGSRYYSIDQIKAEAPSLAEGTVPNFSQVQRDIISLNQLADRQVTPVPRAGEIPGTIDFDLNVKDTPPLHGSLEINNRYSPFTDPLRINGAVNYDNLWQLGHTIGFSFQIAPQDIDEVKVFSGFYLAHVPTVDWLSLMLEGTDQDSNVSTLGGIGVAGKGELIGLRAIISLPQEKDFFHSLSLGIDFKKYEQDVNIAGTGTHTPVTYAPVSAAYSATWQGKGYETDANVGLDVDFRGIGSSEQEFDENRHGADGSFIYLRGDISHTRELPEGLQGFAKFQGQVADKPLVNSEQFSGGGLGTVRGYLESEELGDNAALASAELRTPSLTGLLGKSVDEWRFYVFGEGGVLAIDDPLPEQQARFTLASVGIGTRLRLLNHLNGSLDVGEPLLKGVQTQRYEPLLTFRVWADF